MSQTPLKAQDNLIWNKGCFPDKIVPDEDLVLILREDLSLLGFRTFRLLLVFMVLIAVRILAESFIANILYLQIYDVLFFAINTVLITSFSLMFHNYYLSVQIITNARIIDIDQLSLFKRDVIEMPIDNIQDVQYKQNNLFENILNFGNVTVKSAGDHNNNANKKNPDNGFVFNNVPEPKEVAAKITGLYHEYIDQQRVKEAKMHAQYLSNVLDTKK